MTRHHGVTQLLLQLEAEMRAQSLWAREQPSREALQSTEPFSVDTLSFFQWVQWIMIPRLNAVIMQQQPLPHSCSITPMAEEALRLERLESAALVALFNRLDAALTAPQHG